MPNKVTLDFNELATGTIVDNEYTAQGVTISATGGSNQAMIFDTSNPTGGDWDLASNTAGNVLIISEDGDQNDPDDNACGGTVTFDFAEETYFYGLTLRDIEEGATVTFYDADGCVIQTSYVHPTADGGARHLDFCIDGVASVEVTLPGSGAIDNVMFDQPVNNAPVAVDDALIIDEDQTVVIDVLANDSDPDGDALSVISASANNGEVTINTDGTLTYSPNPDYNGEDVITYEITDGQGNTDTAIVDITICPVNDAPEAIDDVATTDENTAVIVNVLANDTDVDGDPLHVVDASASNGTVDILSDGTLKYTPRNGFDGQDVIHYQIADGNGGIDFAKVTVTVVPTALDGIVEGTEGDDLIDVAYTGDPEGDCVDAGDAILPGEAPNDDIIEAGAGNDTILAGLGDDDVYAGSGNDFADGGEGDDILLGEAGDDTLNGNVGDDFIDGGDGNDVINGGRGKDTLLGGAGDDEIEGGHGNDTLSGGIGDDTLLGGSGNDTVDGGAGDDLIDTRATPSPHAERPDIDYPGLYPADNNPSNDLDVVSGGAGNDTILTGDDRDVIDGGLGNDTIDAGVDDDTVLGGEGDDLIEGGEGNDTIEGGLGDDVIYAGVRPGDPIYIPDADDLRPGNDRDFVDGGAGNDTIFGGDDTDILLGGAGNDYIDGEIDDDEIDGGAGADTLIGGQGDDVITGGTGNDTINAGAGSDTVDGGDGDDVIDTRASDSPFDQRPDIDYPGIYPADEDPFDDRDTVTGGAGNDTILTGDDRDIIDGGLGDDFIDAGVDDDTITAGAGDDFIIGGEGNDIIDGGLGDDTIYAGFGPGVPDAVNIPDATDLRPNNGQDSVFGGAGNDTIFGADDDDTLFGGEGNDFIDGQIDDDRIEGGTGDDILIGGEGADIIGGGADADTFLVRMGEGGGDVIDGGTLGNDFDTLDLSGAGPLNVVVTATDPDGDSQTGFVEFLDGAGGAVLSTLDFTEIENIIPCFTPGTLIATPRGERPVETLQPGDRVITRDNGIQEIRWAGKKDVDHLGFAASPHLKPVMITKGSLGNGLPERDTLVSPNHRILVSSDRTALYFDEREVLVSAKHLVDGKGVHRMNAMNTTYIHFMFDQHEVVLSNGAWTESFQPGDHSLKGIGNSQRQEIFELFPELETDSGRQDYTSARRTLRKHEAELLAR